MPLRGLETEIMMPQPADARRAAFVGWGQQALKCENPPIIGIPNSLDDGRTWEERARHS
jgi:hypothetical protein